MAYLWSFDWVQKITNTNIGLWHKFMLAVFSLRLIYWQRLQLNFVSSRHRVWKTKHTTLGLLLHSGTAVTPWHCCYTLALLLHPGTAVTPWHCCYTLTLLLHPGTAVTSWHCCYTLALLLHPGTCCYTLALLLHPGTAVTSWHMLLHLGTAVTPWHCCCITVCMSTEKQALPAT